MAESTDGVEEEVATGDDEDHVETVTLGEWAQTRPVAGGVLQVLGGIVVAWPPFQALVGFAPTGSLAVGLLSGLGLVSSGVATLVRPSHATALGLVGLVLATTSLLFALGGYLVGMVLAAAGGILTFAWTPPPDPTATE